MALNVLSCQLNFHTYHIMLCNKKNIVQIVFDKFFFRQKYFFNKLFFLFKVIWNLCNKFSSQSGQKKSTSLNRGELRGGFHDGLSPPPFNGSGGRAPLPGPRYFWIESPKLIGYHWLAFLDLKQSKHTVV